MPGSLVAVAALTLAAGLGLLTVAGVPVARAARGPARAAAPRQIAGPGAGLVSLNGMSIARDGTGGVVFLGDASGTEHVYVSRLTGGVFQAPQQVDAGLGGASGQPVIAAGNQGVLVVAFINAGDLYVTQTSGTSGAWSAPRMLHAGAADPALQMSNWGKAYLAFTAPAGAGHDVEVEYYDSGTWQAVSGPMNVAPGDDAGTGAGRPAVATAGDGVGIVAWGEGGHVYARRVWGTSPSVADERLDPSSFGGAAEVGSGMPAVSVGGDSSYPDIVFEEQLSSGAGTWNRVLMTRLVAEDVRPSVAVDGLSDTTPGDAGEPAVAMGEYGRGFAVAGDDSSNGLIATPLTDNGIPAAPPAQISPDPSTAPIAGVPAVAGPSAALIAWEQSPAAGQTEVLLRYAPDGVTLGAPQVLSGSGAQPQPGEGLAAGGDNSGDAAVAWVEGQGGSLSLETAQLYTPPGAGQPAPKFTYVRTSTPLLQWSAGHDSWGPLRYRVTVSGAVLGQTEGQAFRAPALIDGPHAWSVTTLNPAGETATGRTATVFVDTVPPQVSFVVRGRRRVHRRVVLHLHALDVPAAEPGARASGVGRVRIFWGDGSVLVVAGRLTRATHVYSHRGVFRIRVRVFDRAGNRTTVSRRVRIAK